MSKLAGEFPQMVSQQAQQLLGSGVEDQLAHAKKLIKPREGTARRSSPPIGSQLADGPEVAVPVDSGGRDLTISQRRKTGVHEGSFGGDGVCFRKLRRHRCVASRQQRANSVSSPSVGS